MSECHQPTGVYGLHLRMMIERPHRAEFWRVMDFLDEHGYMLRGGRTDDVAFHRGSTMGGLADAYAEKYTARQPEGT